MFKSAALAIVMVVARIVPATIQRVIDLSFILISPPRDLTMKRTRNAWRFVRFPVQRWVILRRSIIRVRSVTQPSPRFQPPGADHGQPAAPVQEGNPATSAHRWAHRSCELSVAMLGDH